MKTSISYALSNKQLEKTKHSESLFILHAFSPGKILTKIYIEYNKLTSMIFFTYRGDQLHANVIMIYNLFISILRIQSSFS